MRIVTFYQKFINIACLNFLCTITLPVTRLTRHILYPGMRYLTFVVLISLSACKSSTTGIQETPTSGKIKIAVDESFKPLLDTEIYTFMQLYDGADITPLYKAEYDVINDFMKDSVKNIVTSRKLTEDQIQYLRDTLIIARTVTFAYDAIALVTNRNNPDTLINYDSVRDIFMGESVTWKDLNPKSKLGSISVIFDNTKSGNIRYFKELFNISDNLPGYFYAVNSNAEVIDYVSRNPGALGIISVNWISDRDDSTSMSFIKKIKVAAVSQQFASDGYYYRPYQGSIYDKSYPFVREIYFITRETFNGLGKGFIQWATAEQGQRIVLKSGLVPATMPIRLVQIKN